MRILYALAIALIGSSVFADDLPDLDKTLGVSRAGLSKATICSTKWGTDARHVTQAMKVQVFALYGYSGNDDAHCEPDAKGHRCEIDHLISRELGGADDVQNLWPEAYGSSPYNAHLKDKLENRLHKEMCAGYIGLKATRDMMVNDWRKAYRVYYGAP